jgi:hypothetical protein
MSKRHWDQLSADLGLDLHPGDSFTLRKAEEMGLLLGGNLETIVRVSDVAGKEFAIEQALNKMQGEWGEVELGVMEYRETGTFVIKVPLNAQPLLLPPPLPLLFSPLRHRSPESCALCVALCAFIRSRRTSPSSWMTTSS